VLIRTRLPNAGAFLCAQAAFKPTYYQGSLLSERFPHLREKTAKSA